MELKIPRKKLVKSILISLGAVVSAWALDWAEVLNAGPLVTGMLAVVVNYLQELADERRKKVEARQLRENPGPPEPGVPDRLGGSKR